MRWITWSPYLKGKHFVVLEVQFEGCLLVSQNDESILFAYFCINLFAKLKLMCCHSETIMYVGFV